VIVSNHPLYQQLILEHSKHPQNFGSLRTPTVEAEEANPVCGDRISLQIVISNRIISDIKFQGEGCAISQASASLMTAHLKGLALSEAEALMAQFRILFTAEAEAYNPALGELEALRHVRQYPVRKKCLLLPWDAFRSALNDYDVSGARGPKSPRKFP